MPDPQPIADAVNSETVVDTNLWLRAGQQSVRDYCGWHVAPLLTETKRLDGDGGETLVLPTRRLVDLATVKVRGVSIDVATLDWGENGVVKLREGCWPDAPGVLEVTMRHGYLPEEVPNLIALMVGIGKRAQSGMRRGAVTSHSVNGASESIATAGGAPISVPLLSIEKESLARYRLTRGPL